MAKVKSWEIDIDGNTHKVEFTRGRVFNNHKIVIDGKQISYDKHVLGDYLGVDIPLTLGSKEVMLFQRGKFVDISVDGYGLDSGEEYIPKLKMPKWNWIFVVLMALLPVVALGGALPVILALIGIYWVIKISVDPYIKNKVVVNVAITIGVYSIMFLIVLFLGMLLTYLGTL